MAVVVFHLTFLLTLEKLPKITGVIKLAFVTIDFNSIIIH